MIFLTVARELLFKRLLYLRSHNFMNKEVKRKEQLRVTVRNGNHEPLDISIVRKRIEGLCFGLNLDYVNLDLVV